MPSILRRRLFGRRAPPSTWGVDWSHPLAANLRSWIMPGGVDSRDLVDNKPPTGILASGAWNGTTSLGPALSSTSITVGGAYWPYPQGLPTTLNRVTILFWYQPTVTLTNDGKIVMIPSSASGWTTPFEGIGVGVSPTVTVPRFYCSTATVETTSDGATANYYQTNVLKCYAVRWDSSTISAPEFWANGDLHQSGATSITTACSLANKRELTLLNRAGTATGEGQQGLLPLVAIWDRVLSVAELEWLYAEPYAVLRPPHIRRIFVTTGAATQTLTPIGLATGEQGSVSAVTPGDVTLAPVGVPSLERSAPSALALTLAPVGVPSGEQSAPSALAQTLAPIGLASGERGSVSVVTPGAVTLTPVGVGSGDQTGVSAVAQVLTATGVSTGEAGSASALSLTVSSVGAPTSEQGSASALALNLVPTPVPSGEQSGVASVSTAQVLTAVGLASPGGIGAASVTPGDVTITSVGATGGVASVGSALELVLAPIGTPSNEQRGISTLAFLLSPIGVPSGEQGGSAAVTPGAVTLNPIGVPSGERSGVFALTLNLTPIGFSSGIASAASTVTLTLTPVGIPSPLGTGVSALAPGAVTLTTVGFGSTGALGLATISTVGSVQTLTPVGVPSSVASGTIFTGSGILEVRDDPDHPDRHPYRSRYRSTATLRLEP
jgi:hypothetical protein